MPIRLTAAPKRTGNCLSAATRQAAWRRSGVDERVRGDALSVDRPILCDDWRNVYWDRRPRGGGPVATIVEGTRWRPPRVEPRGRGTLVRHNRGSKMVAAPVISSSQS